MVQIVVPNAALLALRWLRGASPFNNIIGVVAPGGLAINQTLAEALDAAIKSSLGTSGLAARLHTTVSLHHIGIRDIRTPSQPEYNGTGASVAGTQVADILPPNVALCFSVKTGLAGPAYRGRVYLGGFTEADNTPSGAAATTGSDPAGLFLAGISAALEANGLSWGVVSRPADTKYEVVKTPITRAGFVTEMTSVTLRNPIWDSQRRRAFGGGGGTTFASTKTFVSKS